MLNNKVPNELMCGLYRTVNNMKVAHEKQIADLLEKHGIKEDVSSNDGDPGGVGKGDPTEKRRGIRKKIDALSKRNHTADEKQVLVDELNATYEVK